MAAEGLWSFMRCVFWKVLLCSISCIRLQLAGSSKTAMERLCEAHSEGVMARFDVPFHQGRP